MRRFVLLLAGLLGLFSPAEARMHHPYRAHRIVPAATAPLDGFTQPAAAYSMRRLKSTYTGPAIRLRRASDNAEQDIGFLGFTGFTGSPIDTAAATAFCASTQCFVGIWYDQSGNGRNATAAGSGFTGNQPELIFNCVGFQPCVRTDANTDSMVSASVAWAAGKTTLNAVAKRTSGTGSCINIGKGVNWLLSNAVNTWAVTDNTTNSFNFAASDGAWHAVIGVIDAASSLSRVDAVEAAGANTAGSAAANQVYLTYGGVATICDQTEAVIWDNYVLTATERAALTQNQKGYWP